ncbi:hypothetical protein ACOJEA_004781 [Klebsiella aerogenes]
MAFKSSFVGNNVKVEIADAPTAGGQATTFTTVELVSAFPAAAGSDMTIVTANVFGEEYVQKATGSRSVPDLNLSVFWKPGAVGQEKLATYAKARTLVQVKVTYFENIVDPDSAGYFVVLNGYISSNNVGGDFDAMATRDYVLSVTGAPVAEGEVTAK